jgi:hypothetical protein
MSSNCSRMCVEICRPYVCPNLRLTHSRTPWTHHDNILHKVDIETRRFPHVEEVQPDVRKTHCEPAAIPTFQIFRPKKFPLTLPQKSATPQRPWLAWAAALRQPFGHFCVPATQPKSATPIEPCLVARNAGAHEPHGLRTFVAALRQFWERGGKT